MNFIEFLPEHWDIIKSYAGIYHIRNDWDLMKLDNRTISLILGMVSPKYSFNLYSINLNYNDTFQSNEDRVKCIWKYLHKKKLYDVDKLIKNSKLIKTII